ncbi:MAG: tetratricopeptide repeat protein, partial [Gammaproteobacteria bacterium]|nr:tetratricopeptide repeat protein [Gammaproteobacteria bacterium]
MSVRDLKNRRWPLFYCTLLFALFFSIEGKAELNPPVLVHGPLNGKIAAGETVSHEFDLNAAGNYIVRVTQDHIDVILRDHDQTVEVNTPIGRNEDEKLLISADVAGKYSVSVSAEEHYGPPATYTLQIQQLPDTSPQDRIRIRAEQLMTTAAQLANTSKRANWEAASENYQEAAGLWETLQNTRQQAKTNFCVSSLSYRLRALQNSVDASTAAAHLYRSLNEKRLEANSMHTWGMALVGLGEYEQSAEIFAAALDIQKSLNEQYGAAIIINEIGTLHFYKGDYQEANNWFARARDNFTELQESGRLTLAQQNIGVANFYDGKLNDALVEFEKARKLLDSAENDWNRAVVTLNIGWSQAELGNISDALVKYKEALELFRNLDDVGWQARALRGIAFSYSRIGDLENAMAYFHESLELREKAAEKRGEVAALNNIGRIHRQQGNWREAVKYHKESAKLADTPNDKATAFLQLGWDYLAGNQYAAAKNNFEKTINLMDNNMLGVRGSALQGLGDVLALSDTQRAKATLLEALIENRRTRSEFQEVNTLHSLA